MKQHTKTPWFIHPTGVIIGAEGSSVCTATSEDVSRIVACVNACEGVESELLELGPGMWQKAAENNEKRDREFSDLMRKNARLLEALRGAIKHQVANLDTDSEFYKCYTYNGREMPEWVSAARAAISEAEKTHANPAEAAAEAWLKLNEKK